MAEPRSLTTIGDTDYEAIEAAVMETARGRWFLAEYARRNRTADTGVLLDAIGRLENAVLGEPTTHGLDRLRIDLMDMAKAISRTKTEIAAIHPADREQSRLEAASSALDGIVRTTEKATSDILEAAENVQEAAWTLREGGADEALCDELDRRATEIYTACSFQDITAQRTGKIVQTLRFLESRINAMIDIWGGETEHAAAASATIHAFSGPEDVADLSQSDVDIVIVDEDDLFAGSPSGERSVRPALIAEMDEIDGHEVTFVDLGATLHLEPAPAAEVVVLREAAPKLQASAGLDVAEAFGDLDVLDTREKLRRFT